MDRRIRGLALFLVVCFGLLIAQLNNIQIRQASSLNAKGPPYTATKSEVSPYNLPRGDIYTADGVIIAKTVPTKDAEQEQRVYPQGELYTDVTGYYDTTAFSDTGLESEYDNFLQPHEATAKTLRQSLTEQSGTDTVVTTINSTVQLAAETALAPYSSGAVVAINPQTGAILALDGKPTFNANDLAVHDAATANASFIKLENRSNEGASPLINYATKQIFNPGSTFKVITTATMFDHMPSLQSTIWPVKTQIPLPQSNKTLQNFGGESCGGSLQEILTTSCDTAYTLMGIQLGAQNLNAEATAFGFNETPPLDIPSDEVSASCFPPVSGAASQACNGAPAIGGNDPVTAYSSIGQENVKESALQDALVAAAIGDGGKMMTPHLMSKIISNSGEVVEAYKPTVWKQATSEETADTVRHLMLGVVGPGGTAAKVGFNPADDVAAKTGTAESGTQKCSTNWLIATAPAGDTDTPTIAVAAVVPYQPGTSCTGTGAQYAGPVVKAVLNAALAAQS